MDTKIKLYFLLFLLITTSFLPVYSAESNIVIKEIIISGLKRTHEKVVFQIIDPIAAGSSYTDETEELIIQKLRETGIFIPDIEITSLIKENHAIVTVNVKDKWTLIPIPIVSVSKGESWNAGVLTIENNLFGYYKTLGLGFFYGSRGWTLLSFFSDPFFLQSDFTITASLAAGFDEITDLFPDETEARKYETDRLGLSFGFEYPLSDKLNMGSALEYDLSLLRDNRVYAFDDLNTLGLKSTIGWKDVYYDIPYEKGFKADLSVAANWELYSQTFFPTVESNIQYSFSPWLKHLINLKAEAGWGLMPVQKQFRLGGMDGSRVLPMGKIAADEFASSTFIYNIPLWIFKGGTISSKVFYELGYFRSDLIERTLFHGPGFGLEFFINNLAIPAVGLNLGWNLETGEMQFSAGIGM